MLILTFMLLLAVEYYVRGIINGSLGKMRREYKYNSSIAFGYLRKAIIFPLIIFIVVSLVVAYHEGGISDFVMNRVFLVIIIVMFSFPILLFLEQLYYSISRKVIIEGDIISYYYGSSKVSEFHIDEIKGLFIFTETEAIHFITGGVFQFGVLRVRGEDEIIISCFVMDDISKIAPKKSKRIRMVFPSISIYNAFMINNEYSI